MVCDQIESLLGMSCYPLNDCGSIAMIATPFTFEDGDGFPVYVEKIGSHVRFFDDGGVLLHFKSRGLSFENGRRARFIRMVASENGAALNEDGEVEVWSSSDTAAYGFARYISTLIGLVSWEKEQKGGYADASFLIEEVALCLQSWKTGADIARDREYQGISGRAYTIDFTVDGEVLLAIRPHPNSVSSALKKMIDIISAPVNRGLKMTVVLDDRQQLEDAKSEGAVLNAVAEVMMMSKLAELAKISSLAS